MIIDLRSDTVTKPTPAMLDAMSQALVGDDVFGEDPTVNELEQRIAAMLGKEAALFCASGTMANQIAVAVHTRPLEETICHQVSHIYNYETGAYAFHAGSSLKILDSEDGLLTAEQVVQSINPNYDWLPTTRLVWLENTSNKSGGNCYPLIQLEEISKASRQHQLALHLDGARLFNALVETHISPTTIGDLFDSISVCFSKGLGAPVGSALVGDTAFIRHARKVRKAMGGGMRQVGYLAAACIYALDHHISRLKDDHRRAKSLESALQNLPMIAEVLPVQTNIIMIKMPSAADAELFQTQLAAHNIRISSMGNGLLRMVTHLDFTEAMLNYTLDILQKKINFSVTSSVIPTTTTLTRQAASPFHFGRYSEAYKSNEQNAFFDRAMQYFEQNEYIEAQKALMQYLYDPTQANITYQELPDGSFNFQLVQGSKVIEGMVTAHKIFVETPLVSFTQPHVGFMRKLMELNYGLQFCRFAIKDDKVVLKFESPTTETPPEKLYIALREMATRADREDDLLLESFPDLMPISTTAYIQPAEPQEKALKYAYYTQWLLQELERANRLDKSIFAPYIGRILLNLAFKIDYCLMPQGKLMDELNGVFQIYLEEQPEWTPADRNEKMKAILEKIKNFTSEEIGKQLYYTHSTFGITQPTLLEQITPFIKEELANAIWCKENKLPDVALICCEYIAQYCLYYFGLPDPIKAFLHLIVQIINNKFFQDLGMPEQYYNESQQTLYAAAVAARVQQLIQAARLLYPNFNIPTKQLKFTTPYEFCTTLLAALAAADYTMSETQATATFSMPEM